MRDTLQFLLSVGATVCYLHEPTRRRIQDALLQVVDAVARAAAGSSGMDVRAKRVQHWKSWLAPAPRRYWEARGVLGGSGLKEVDCSVFDAQLERELVEGQPEGAAVHQREMMWVQRADGQWALVAAVLDSGNTGGLCIPAKLAHELGYADAAGEPLPQHQPFLFTAVFASLADGVAVQLPKIKPVAFSIAGREFKETTIITPARCDLLSHLATGFEVLVPVQTIRKLRQEGVQFIA